MRRWNSLYDDEPLFLAPKYHDILLSLLQAYLPDRTVWAFGSRATGKYLGRFSDLDLAMEERLPPEVRSDLLEALDASDLPIKVDLVELDKVNPAFAERIRPDLCLYKCRRPKQLCANGTPYAPSATQHSLPASERITVCLQHSADRA